MYFFRAPPTDVLLLRKCWAVTEKKPGCLLHTWSWTIWLFVFLRIICLFFMFACLCWGCCCCCGQSIGCLRHTWWWTRVNWEKVAAKSDLASYFNVNDFESVKELKGESVKMRHTGWWIKVNWGKSWSKVWPCKVLFNVNDFESVRL